jgi:hypothetical protein
MKDENDENRNDLESDFGRDPIPWRSHDCKGSDSCRWQCLGIDSNFLVFSQNLIVVLSAAPTCPQSSKKPPSLTPVPDPISKPDAKPVTAPQCDDSVW